MTIQDALHLFITEFRARHPGVLVVAEELTCGPVSYRAILRLAVTPSAAREEVEALIKDTIPIEPPPKPKPELSPQEQFEKHVRDKTEEEWGDKE